jgi:geranylgeranyl diphosphate synthase type I
MIKARDKGLDLKKYQRTLSPADINAAIRDLTAAGVLDEVKQAASDLVKASNKHLSVLPPTKERQLLMDIGEFFVTRSF